MIDPAALPWFAVVGVAALVAALLAHGVARIVIGMGGRLLDVPGPRSSHTVPTPRGGGIGIAIVGIACVLALAWVEVWPPGWAYTAAGFAVVAAIGALDDARPQPAALRLLAHIAAAILVVHAALLPWYMADTGWPTIALMVLALVASVNLHNFMDGIDALLASQAVWCGAVFAVLCSLAAQPASALFALLLAAAAVGFLPSNWPRARVFLGDGGSGYIGLAIGWLALVGWSSGAVALPESLLIGSAFLVDSGLTLLLRAARGERVWHAHREHLYQHLAQACGRHLPVTAAYMAWNLMVGLPALLLMRFVATTDAMRWAIAAGVLVVGAVAWWLVRVRVVPIASARVPA
jgi:UDP-N-acetylmuramyl pentapeptide phosphotransferase/UDP-N-acetylglucosamine-1-phosphate transferase